MQLNGRKRVVMFSPDVEEIGHQMSSESEVDDINSDQTDNADSTDTDMNEASEYDAANKRHDMIDDSSMTNTYIHTLS